jgi:1,4-dihydroxy-2-naphthoate octaprenyltransferase
MTSLNIWFQGARPKTLGAAIAPVLVGSSIAYYEKSFDLTISLLALIVSISIQIAVNYANDYSDGIKGTDDQRVGPVRLVGQKLASPKSVKAAAIIFFSIAALAGLFITILSNQWWFLLLGLSAIVAAWTYTGGPKPYGYAGLGELFVFIYFGLVAVLGTTYAQTLYLKPYFFLYAISIGLFASAILVANNLRDREKDKQNKKNTLAVKLGDQKTRNLYVLLMILPFILVLSLFIYNGINPGTRIGATIQIQLLALFLAWSSIKPVINKVIGKELIPVLIKTGQTELLWALLVSLALVLETN